jgi:hypothetical protein
MGFVDKNTLGKIVLGDFRGAGISRIEYLILDIYNVANDPISYRQGKNYQIITGITGSNQLAQL